MLYPKEDIAERRSSGRKVLVYHCRSCMKKEAIEEMKDPVHSNIVVDTSRSVFLSSFLYIIAVQKGMRTIKTN